MLHLDNMLAWVDDLETDRLFAVAPEGTWMVDADRRGPAQIRFQLDGLTHENEESLRAQIQQVDRSSREAHRLANILGDQVLPIGEAFTQEAAEVAIDMLTVGDISLLAQEILDENGYRRFARVGDYEILRKQTETGRYEINLDPCSVILTFTPKGRRSAQVLLSLRFSTGEDAEHANMHFWPEQVEQNFHTLAVQAAMVVTDLFVAEGRDVQRSARSLRSSSPMVEMKLAA